MDGRREVRIQNRMNSTESEPSAGSLPLLVCRFFRSKSGPLRPLLRIMVDGWEIPDPYDAAAKAKKTMDAVAAER